MDNQQYHQQQQHQRLAAQQQCDANQNNHTYQQHQLMQQRSQQHLEQQLHQPTMIHDIIPTSSSSSSTSSSASSSLLQQNVNVDTTTKLLSGANIGTPAHSTSTISSINYNSNKMKVVAGYALHEKLGSGSFAVVYKGVRLNSNNSTNYTCEGATTTDVDMTTTNVSVGLAPIVAIKAIDRNSDKLTPKVLSNLEKEISILRTYKHRNIVCLQDVQKTTNHFYLLLEYCAGGDLQKLIRDRANGRLSERLCRRLMKDLCSGLQFLHDYQLIHRDIKPQNLLLTGALPLDETNDPSRTQELETIRNQINFPSNQFSLKIADFGFARHLQTTSLAETLCGSPLYMAPEILSHQRYDDKADLWSVGTVLFEMIAGKPPFSGDNHIHLLQNIQKNAVRLPPGVRVSKECVALLRILLNRNPSSRATFHEFVIACNNFVSLGTSDNSTTNEERNMNAKPNTTNTPVMTNPSSSGGIVQTGALNSKTVNAENVMKFEDSGTNNTKKQYQNIIPTSNIANMGIAPLATEQQQLYQSVVTPLFGPVPSSFSQQQSPMTVSSSSYVPRTQRGVDGGSIALGPIGSSDGSRTNQSPPPVPDHTTTTVGVGGSKVYTIPEHSDYYQRQNQLFPGQSQSQSLDNKPLNLPPRRSESYGSSSQHSSDDFVMVEHGSSLVQANNNTTSVENKFSSGNIYQQTSEAGVVTTCTDPNNMNYNTYHSKTPQEYNKYRLQQSPPASPAGFASFRKVMNPVVKSFDYMIPPLKQQREQSYRGMLSTSPGTGGALMGLLMGTTRDVTGSAPHTSGGGGLLLSSAKRNDKISSDAVIRQQLEAQIKSATKMLAASEDVGRRAVSVAHLGDHCALQGIKLFMMLDSYSSSSMSSVHPMEGIEEEDRQNDGTNDDSNNAIADSSSSVIISYRRRSSISEKEKMMSEVIDEMPFALESDSPPLMSVTGIPTRPTTLGASMIKGSSPTFSSSSRHHPNNTTTKPTTAMIRSHFSEALLCYVKALNMLKGAFAAVENVKADVSEWLGTAAGGTTSSSGVVIVGRNNIQPSSLLSTEQVNHLSWVRQRCDITNNWLAGQFNGVLERGDAANVEIRKFPTKPGTSTNTPTSLNDEKSIIVDNSNFGASPLVSKHAVSKVASPSSPAPPTSNTISMVASVEELIYNHALALGREGAVKQLLGQNEHARNCFRSAGLLAETLLMDSNNVVGEDRTMLEEYVDAFATQISELDVLIVQQQQQVHLFATSSSHGNSNSRFLSIGSSQHNNNNSFQRSPQQPQHRTSVSFDVSTPGSVADALPLALGL